MILSSNSTATTTTTTTTSLRKMSDTQEKSIKRDCEIFTNYINRTLGNIQSLKEYLPIPSSNDVENHPLFDRIRDGIILAHLIQQAQPSSIQLSRMVTNLDLDQMDQMHSKVTFQVNANLNMVIAAAKSIPSLVVVNLGAEDFLNKKKDLILGILWQLINHKLSSKLSLLAHPELVLLVKDGESLASLAAMKPEKLLLRWLNYHLQGENITNFGDDISVDIYLKLICKIVTTLPREDMDTLNAYVFSGESNTTNSKEKNDFLVKLANDLNCNDGYFSKEYEMGFQSCSKINYAFLCTLFNNHIGLKIPTQKEFDHLKGEVCLVEEKMKELKLQTQNALLQKQRQEEEMGDEISQLKETILKLQCEKQDIKKEFLKIMEEEKEKVEQRLKEEIGEELEIAERERELENVQREKEEQSMKSEILSIISSMSEILSTEELEASNLLNTEMLDVSINSCTSLIKTMSVLASTLIARMKEEQSSSAALKASLKEKDRLNQLMSERVKQCNAKTSSKTMVTSDDHEQQQQFNPNIPNSIDSRRGSLLKRVFGTD